MTNKNESALERLIEGGGWLYIDGAPKDATPILIKGIDDRDIMFIFTCRYENGLWLLGTGPAGAASFIPDRQITHYQPLNTAEIAWQIVGELVSNITNMPPPFINSAKTAEFIRWRTNVLDNAEEMAKKAGV